MYKKQMTFQKIVCLLAVIAGALLFLYSLGMTTDLYDGLYWTDKKTANLLDDQGEKVLGADGKAVKIQYDEVFYDIQDFNRQLTGVGIAVLLMAVLLYLTQTHARRRYYIGNYISTGIFAIGAVGASVWSFMQLHLPTGYKAQFLTMISQVGDQLAERAVKFKKEYITSTFWFDLQYLVAAILIVVTILLIVNLIWKKSLMRAEASLIEAHKEC